MKKSVVHCGMQEGTSQAEVTSNSKQLKPVVLAVRNNSVITCTQYWEHAIVVACMCFSSTLKLQKPAMVCLQCMYVCKHTYSCAYLHTFMYSVYVYEVNYTRYMSLAI